MRFLPCDLRVAPRTNIFIKVREVNDTYTYIFIIVKRNIFYLFESYTRESIFNDLSNMFLALFNQLFYVEEKNVILEDLLNPY